MREEGLMRKSFPAVAVTSLTLGTKHDTRSENRHLVTDELIIVITCIRKDFHTLIVIYEDSAKFPFRMMSSETVPCSSHTEYSG